MAEIIYKEKKDAFYRVVSVKVYLEGKEVGIIKRILAKGDEFVSKGWRYFPRGHEGGDLFPTLEECKESLGEPNG